MILRYISQKYHASKKWSSTFMKAARLDVWLSGTVFIVVCIASWLLWQQAQQSLDEKMDTKFQAQADRLQNSIKGNVLLYASALRGVQGLFNASEFVSEAEWKVYVESLSLEDAYPGLRLVGFAEAVSPATEDEYTSQTHIDGSAYSIWPGSEGRIMTPITYLAAARSYEVPHDVLGFDLMSDPARRAAMEQSVIDSPAISGRVDLLVKRNGEPVQGVLIFVPIHTKERLHGYAYAPLAIDRAIQVAVDGDASGLNLEIFDGGLENPKDESTRIYGKKLDSNYTPVHTRDMTIAILGRTWTVRVSCLPEYHTEAPPYYILWIGGGVGSAFAASVFTIASSRRRVLRRVASMTKDLQEKNRTINLANIKNQAIVASMNVGVIVFDEFGAIQKTNKVFESMFGLAVDAITDKRLEDVLVLSSESGCPLPANKNPIDRVIADACPLSYNIGLCRDGSSVVPVRLSTSPLVVEDKLMGAICVVYDRTAEQGIEKAKDEFVSLTSHQLRTPLTIIRLSAEVLLKSKGKILANRQAEYLERIDISTKRMAKLVGEILDISRIKLDRLKPAMKRVSVNTILKNEVAVVRPIAKQSGMRIKVELADRPTYVLGDAVMIGQAIHNLLTNALAYSREETRHLPVIASITNDGGYAVITISDHGPGISDADKPKIAHSFFRAENARLIRADGNGLGLYLSRIVTEAHGGTFGFTSVEGEGSQFHIKLPLIK